MSQVLERVTFAIPRGCGYTKIPVLEKLAGQPVREFAHVVLKELVDTGLDAAEDAGIAPEIEVRVTPAGDGVVRLTVADNGAGMPGSKVAGFCDFTTSTSDKTGYVSPARGAQGNAWPCIISIPFALGIRPGTVVIGTQGIRHLITPEMVLGERLTINHVPEPCAAFASGTVVSVPLPASLELDVSRWVWAYATVNPHATFSVTTTTANGEKTRELYKPAVQCGWRKWLPSRPTSPHWYDQDNLRDLISALLAAGEDKTLGGFIREFDGLTSTAKARKLAAMVPGAVKSLSGFKQRPDAIGVLLDDMKMQTRPVKPAALGVVPGDHYKEMIAGLFGISRGRAWHERKEIVHDGVPWAVDVTVAVTERPGQVIYATNFGVAFSDPLATTDLHGSDQWHDATGSASFLRSAGAYPSPANWLRAAVVHVHCAAPRWTDTGKVKLIVPPEVEAVFAQAFAKATKTLREERGRARKDAVREQRRQEREERAYWEQREREEREPSLKAVVRGMLGDPSLAASRDGSEPMAMRNLYNAARDHAAGSTSKDLTWRNFRQILAEYEGDYGQIPWLDRETAPEVQADLSRHPRGPEELKAAAAQLGLGSYTELLVLSRDNDPYAMGKPAEQKKARWFADLAARVMAGLAKLHIRGFHYRWFTAGAEGLDGRRYENDQEHWQEISKAAKIARVLGLVDPEAFEDRRNKALRIYTEPRPDTGPGVTLSTGDVEGWQFPALSLDGDLPPLELPPVEVCGYEYSPTDQPEVLVLITEKLEDVLEPVCSELGVDLLAGTGYSSYTRAIQLLRHAEARGQRLHGWYVSDYDAAGENMPIAFARACQYFAEQLGITAEITLEPLALTAAQVERYNLPKAPDKKQTELDALEALHPGELGQILRAAIEGRRDATLQQRMEMAGDQAQPAAQDAWDAATDDLRAELELIEADARSVIAGHQESEQRKATEIAEATAELRRQIQVIEHAIKDRYAEADAQAEDSISAANARLEQLAGQVRQRWDSAEFDLPDRPEPEADVDDRAVLYDSRRHWLDQLAAFKAARGGTASEPEEAFV